MSVKMFTASTEFYMSRQLSRQNKGTRVTKRRIIPAEVRHERERTNSRSEPGHLLLTDPRKGASLD